MGGEVGGTIEARFVDPTRRAQRAGKTSVLPGVRDSWIGACGGRAYQRAPWRVAHVNINSVDHWRPHPRKAGDGVR